MRKLFLLLLLLSAPFTQFEALSKIPVEVPLSSLSHGVGVRTLEYVDSSRKNRPVTVELWYPAEKGGEMREAPVAKGKGPFPLIVMSHGHRGDRREKSWLAERLVEEGYAVAAVQHYGNDRATYDPLISLCFWERPRDISFTLDRMGRDTTIRGDVDWTRVGFVGYSLGGMTGLSLAGAVAKGVKERILKEPEAVSAVGKENLERFSFEDAEKDYREPRIRSFLLLCPATHPYSSRSLREIRSPIGLVVAVGDEILPHKQHGYRLIKNLVPHKLKVLRRGISHYVFLDKKLAKKPVSKQEETQREIGSFAVDFFRETLL